MTLQCLSSITCVVNKTDPQSSSILCVFFLMIRRPPRSTLFPTRRSSDLGKLRGGRCRGALAFKGIPYAGPESERSEEHTSLQSLAYLVYRLLLEKKKSYAPLTPRQESIVSMHTFRYR